MSIDTAALRAKLRVYDQTLPRCTKRIVRVSNHALDYVAEEERAEWEMRLTYPCVELEGHEGQCREGRAILGWPGFKTLTALLDEVERLRELLLNAGWPREAEGVAELAAGAERAAVVAWLRAEVRKMPEVSNKPAWFHVADLADNIERGEHRREEER